MVTTEDRHKDDGKDKDEDQFLAEYEKEQAKYYWFPPIMKAVAWFLCFGLSATCIVLLILYGLTFGPIKSQTWISSIVISVLLQIFLIQPIKIFVMALLSSFVLKWDRVMAYRLLSTELFKNPPNENLQEEAETMRRELAECYLPPDPSKLMALRAKIRKRTEMQGILSDLIYFAAFIIVLYILVFTHRTSSSYDAFHTIRNLVVYGKYTDSIPLGRVMTYDQFLEYVNKTLILALMRNITQVINTNDLEDVGKNLLPEGFEDIFPQGGKRMYMKPFSTKYEGFDDEEEEEEEEEDNEDDEFYYDKKEETKVVLNHTAGYYQNETNDEDTFAEGVPPVNTSKEMLDFVQELMKTQGKDWMKKKPESASEEENSQSEPNNPLVNNGGEATGINKTASGEIKNKEGEQTDSSRRAAGDKNEAGKETKTITDLNIGHADTENDTEKYIVNESNEKTEDEKNKTDEAKVSISDVVTEKLTGQEINPLSTEENFTSNSKNYITEEPAKHSTILSNETITTKIDTWPRLERETIKSGPEVYPKNDKATNYPKVQFIQNAITDAARVPEDDEINEAQARVRRTSNNGKLLKEGVINQLTGDGNASIETVDDGRKTYGGNTQHAKGKGTADNKLQGSKDGGSVIKPQSSKDNNFSNEHDRLKRAVDNVKFFPREEDDHTGGKGNEGIYESKKYLPAIYEDNDDDGEVSNDFDDDDDNFQDINEWNNFKIPDLPAETRTRDNAKRTQSGKRIVTPEKIKHKKNINVYDPSLLPLIDRGWATDQSFKLIGRIRMRQVRVQKESCHHHPAAAKRSKDCAGALSWFNVETKSFGLGWQDARLEDPITPEYDFEPWKYRSSYETGDYLYSGKFKTYPGGGYLLPLGKTVTNARLTLQYMKYFNWVDMKTRVIFIDFTLYSVDANIFSACTIVFEIASHGVFIPSYYIYSSPLLFDGPYASIFVFVLGIIFFVFIFSFFVREGMRCRRTDLKVYVTHGWPVIDFVIAVLGFILIIFYVVRTIYVTQIMQELSTKSFNEYISFKSVVFWDKLANHVSAVMICLATIKVFQLFTFHLVLHRFDDILHFEFKYFLGAFLIYMAVVSTYAVLFHGTIGTMKDEYFSNLFQGIPYTMTLNSRATDLGSIFYEYPQGLAEFTVLFLVMFLSITSSFNVGTMLVRYRRFALKPLRSTYQIGPYLKYRLFKKESDPPRLVVPPPEPELISLVKKETVSPPLLINEIRCQAMKRIALEELTDQSHKEDTMENIASIAISNDDQRPALDHFLVGDNTKRGVCNYRILTQPNIEKMKRIANDVIKERNNELKQQNERKRLRFSE